MSVNQLSVKPSKRNDNIGTNVWQEYSKLAAEYNPINLGIGYPDCPGPKFVIDAFIETAKSSNFLLNQYTRMTGHKRLVDALAKLYSKVTGIEIDPMTEMLISTGASGALYTALNSFVDSGDEVIIIEPFFDMYDRLVKYAGATPKHIALKPTKEINDSSSTKDWTLDIAEMEALFNSQTKAIILNSPNNPLGKVFSREELEKIAELCIKWNVLCISDEVYEWLVYDNEEHIRMCTLPGMWERTITIGSAGKAFSVTGWKIGWAYGHKNLMEAMFKMHIVTCATPLQEAAAIAVEHEIQTLGTDESYFHTLRKELCEKRDFMVNFLKKAGMHCIVPQGAYFILADWSDLESNADLATENDAKKDFRFTKWLIKNLKILGMPTSPFFSEKNQTILSHGIRFCFFKQDDTLKEAEKKILAWKQTRA